MNTVCAETVLLISPEGWQKESVNLGLAYLASALIAAGFSVYILDVNRYAMSDDALVQRAQQLNPMLIGISIKTATAREGARLADLLSEVCPASPIVCGGPHMTLCPEAFMRSAPKVLFGVMGEGEQAIVKLALAVCSGTDVSGIRGLVWRRGDNVVVNQWSPPEDLDSLPLPNLDVVEGFSWDGFRYPIVTSRGCPFGCIYCCVNKLTGSRKWRFRSPENIIDELEEVVRTKNISQFEIWDDNFTLDLKRAKAICRLLIERDLNLSWYCHNGIRADRIDFELAQLMKQAGCTSIAFGIESGNPTTFDSINKGEPLSAVVEAVRLVKSVGIMAVGYFIIGLPGDTLERFVDTVRFQRALRLHHFVFGMLIPYPHTEVWDIVQQRGVMFCDITQSQHFSEDIVPISFELPEFPKKDMVRAFYVAKYFDVLEAVGRVQGHSGARVVYLCNQNNLHSLAGLIIAAGDDVEHVIIGALENQVRSLSTFNQVPATARLRFMSELQPDILRGMSVLICANVDIPQKAIFSNCGLVLLDPARHLHQAVQVRRAVRDVPLVPRFVLSGLGVIQNLPTLLDTFGRKKLLEVANIQVVRPILAKYGVLRQRMFGRWGVNNPALLTMGGGLLSKAYAWGIGLVVRRYRKLSPTHQKRVMRVVPYITVAYDSFRFLRVKWSLVVKRNCNAKYPYNENSTYL